MLNNKKIKKYFDITFLRFVIVGIANTVFGTAIMFLFYNLFHFSYWFSSASNYVFGSILSYFLNKYFTFKVTDKSIKHIIKFIVNITICYFVAYGGAKPLIKLILSSSDAILQDNISMLVGMVIFVILNYIGQRFFVFKKEN